ncbi:hypothetical protein GH714_022361 [Hevea brasiliensis]|uniref:Coenzyme Q-binding protein COQ10 START domain-containing protein n=1 Tax=Hevea brasiliensis TaxID=3981 RepID=A0A6A6NIM4_HEVBR|nr:hypothetical protein GH714_022361 [Hevea brasiliensis]
MSATAAIAFAPLSPTLLSTKNNSKVLFSPILAPNVKTTISLRPFLFRVQYGSPKRSSTFTGFKPFSPPVMEWQDCTVKRDIDVPVAVAYKCYSDRESIPRWMPFISSVKVLEDKPDLSRWSLKYKAFGRDIEFSWLARNMQLTVSYEVPQLLVPVATVSILTTSYYFLFSVNKG